ncbi:MAG: LytTR family DNA-binding domain-containing protein [Peptostreptococcus sp.]|uniref:LytTR family DNA-binding domain-containing protein n=1 Tax=Peptostreptococcus TaxID=1257 RepID=UPI0007675F9C|nr:MULTISPECIES: LytTR family DNA-binding domain-containing protein [Peptostreptococcus]MDU1265718.1 LytTR family DNA-binding domain-containing protein [Peptostreptococcus sp.]
MKIDIIIDETIEETRVKIYAREYSKEVETIKDLLADRLVDKLVAFRDKEVFILSYEEIIRIFAQDKSVFVKTEKGTFSSRLTLYELDQRLDKRKFIRISRSDIVNLDFVKKLDLSFTGTIAVELNNGDVAYVSRRNLKKFRKALGL